MTKTAVRVQKHRANLRKPGLRPVQIWVPDTRKRGFADECHRQSALLKGDSADRDVLAFIEKAADLEEWKE